MANPRIYLADAGRNAMIDGGLLSILNSPNCAFEFLASTLPENEADANSFGQSVLTIPTGGGAFAAVGGQCELVSAPLIGTASASGQMRWWKLGLLSGGGVGTIALWGNSGTDNEAIVFNVFLIALGQDISIQSFSFGIPTRAREL